jgi:hypothetical protein
VAAGSYALASKDLTLTDSGRNVPVKIRVTYPLKVTGQLPVIVFSPHQSGSPDQYTELIEQWASHGYVCIALSHADTPNSGRSSEPGYTDRPKDVSHHRPPRRHRERAGGFDGELIARTSAWADTISARTRRICSRAPSDIRRTVALRRRSRTRGRRCPAHLARGPRSGNGRGPRRKSRRR